MSLLAPCRAISTARSSAARTASRSKPRSTISAIGATPPPLRSAPISTHMIGFLVPTFDEFHARMLEHLARSVRQTGRALLTYCHGGDPRIVAEAA